MHANCLEVGAKETPRIRLETVGWDMPCFGDPHEYLVLLGPEPRTVETVMNHRVFGGQHIMAVISGGVRVNTWEAVAAERIQTDRKEELSNLRSAIKPAKVKPERWWWD